MIPLLWLLWWCHHEQSKKVIVNHSLGQGREENS